MGEFPKKKKYIEESRKFFSSEMCGGDLSRKLDWILRRTKQTKQASFVSD